MSSLPASQLTLNFEPSLPERFGTLREYVAHRTPLLAKSAKVIAADMDMSPSTLSRKLNPAGEDTQRLNCDDLEGWLKSTGDVAAVIEYLAAKFMDSPEARKSRTLRKVDDLVSQLTPLLQSLREAA